MMGPKLDGLFRFMIAIGVVAGLLLWGTWEAIDYFFIEDDIVTSKPITPELRITVKNNKIDTLYIYRKP